MVTSSITHIFQGTFPQLLAGLSGTLIAISDGMQYGWSAPVVPILLSKNSPIPCTKHEAEWTEYILCIGAFVGLPITMYLVDKIGRKKSLLLASFLSVIVWVMTAVANRIEYILVARFFSGIASNMAFVAAPMYVAEIADQKIRGFLTSLISLMMLVGILLVYSVVPFVPFYVPSIIGAVIVLAELIIFPFMPESPNYLLSKGYLEEAKASLTRLGRNKDIDKELEVIGIAMEKQKSKNCPPDPALVKSKRKALLILVVLQVAQYFSSFSVILMNLHSILKAVDSIYMDATTAAIIFAAIMLAAAAIASLFIDKYGRKMLLITSTILTGLSLLVISIYFTLKKSEFDMVNISWLPIVSLMVYACVFKVGLGLLPNVVIAELFPTQVKAIGKTLPGAMYMGLSFISLQVYHLLADAYGIHVPFYIFSCSCFLVALFTAIVIPETKGKTLEEIQHILKG